MAVRETERAFLKNRVPYTYGRDCILSNCDTSATFVAYVQIGNTITIIRVFSKVSDTYEFYCRIAAFLHPRNAAKKLLQAMSILFAIVQYSKHYLP